MIDRNGCTRTRIRSICIVLALALVALLPAAGSASPGSPERPDQAIAADSDGDGIADDFDPDDDDDGITDDQEGASEKPGPDILDPGKDTDTDGIPNVLDPDDNDNGVTDEEDPQSFPPSGNGGSSNPPSGGGGSSNPPTAGSPSTPPRPAANPSVVQSVQDQAQGNRGVLIQALPVTGAGTVRSAASLPTLLTWIAAILGASGSLMFAGQRPTNSRVNQ